MSEYGIAVDIGTSTIYLSIFDISERRRVALHTFSNPQSVFGEDVISRLKYELNRDSKQTSLTDIIREELSEQLESFVSSHSLSNNEISDVVIVGNTPMHHLLFQFPLGSLLEEPFRIKHSSAIEINTREIGLNLDATCYSPPLIQSFVGSDALAVILGFGLTNDVYPSIALDIGTNSEIIVQYYNKIWIASAASGPAFEGMSLRNGMPAVEGAISKVMINTLDKTLSFETVGNAQPKGICGSGAVSALGVLRTLGLIDTNGSIIRNLHSKYINRDGDVYRVELYSDFDPNHTEGIYLDQMDIRMLQQSKASIRAVIELLLKESNCSPDEMQTICLTGAFGNGLDISDAIRIGMFPEFRNLQSVNQQIGGALLGAEILLWYKPLRDNLGEILDTITYVEMMDNPKYQELHSTHLFIP